MLLPWNLIFWWSKKYTLKTNKKKSPSQLIEERVAPKIIEKYCDETKKKECLIKRKRKKHRRRNTISISQEEKKITRIVFWPTWKRILKMTKRVDGNFFSEQKQNEQTPKFNYYYYFPKIHNFQHSTFDFLKSWNKIKKSLAFVPPPKENYTLKNKTTFPKTLKKIVICPFFNWNWFPNSCSKSKIKQKRKTNQKKMEWELFFFFPKLTIRNSIDNNATPTPMSRPLFRPQHYTDDTP